MNERAVSELVAFILIFGIIMTGATFALMIGQDHISDIGDSEQTENAEHAMELIGQSLNGIDQSRSASTVGTINLNDGSLSLTSGSSTRVVVENGSEYLDTTHPTGGITYSLDDTVVRYENGMVLRADRGNGIARIDPKMACTPGEQAIVSVVSLDAPGDRQVASGRASVVGYHNRTELLYPINRSGAGSALNATNVTVEVSTDHADVWDDQMAEKGWTVDGAGEYSCDVGDAGRVNVRRTLIDLSVDR